MKKINQIATISDVSLNEKLKEWNEENDAFRVQLRIAYAADNSKDDEDDDLLSLADFEEAGASVGKTYTCLINFDSLLVDKHTEKEQDKALAKLVEKFKGKKPVSLLSTLQLVNLQMARKKPSMTARIPTLHWLTLT